jgi:transposase InsO family protein
MYRGSAVSDAANVTVRRACHIMGMSSSMLYYTPAPDRDQELRECLQTIARPGIGYRMARALVLPQFGRLNHKRVYRLWKQGQFALKKRRKKRRSGAKVPVAATRANQVWCLDFCHDACLNGTKLKVLAIKDEYTRECLALEWASSLNSPQVRGILQRLMHERGAPEYLRSDNGPEFIARYLSVWLVSQGSRSQYIKPGAPWQNGHAESFMARLRAECLDAEVFYNVADAKVKLKLFRHYYNQERPHSALGYVPPAQFAQQIKSHGE